MVRVSQRAACAFLRGRRGAIVWKSLYDPAKNASNIESRDQLAKDLDLIDSDALDDFMRELGQSLRVAIRGRFLDLDVLPST